MKVMKGGGTYPSLEAEIVWGDPLQRPSRERCSWLAAPTPFSPLASPFWRNPSQRVATDMLHTGHPSMTQNWMKKDGAQTWRNEWQISRPTSFQIFHPFIRSFVDVFLSSFSKFPSSRASEIDLGTRETTGTRKSVFLFTLCVSCYISEWQSGNDGSQCTPRNMCCDREC